VSNQFEGFISSHEAYESLTYEEYEANGKEPYKDFLKIENEGEMKSAMPVVTGAFSFFSNKEGIIQFGNEVWKIKYDEFDKFNFSELSLYQNKNFQGMRTLETFPIERSNFSRNFWEDECDKEYQNSRGRTRRVKGEIKIKTINNLSYSEVEVSTSHQIKSGFVWWGDKADLSQNGYMSIDVVNLGKGSQVGLIKTINKTIINKSSWNSTLGLCIACTASFNNALVITIQPLMA
jgi:hypothetical protein